MEGQVKSATYLTSICFPLRSQEDDVFAVAGLCSTDAPEPEHPDGYKAGTHRECKGSAKASLQHRHP